MKQLIILILFLLPFSSQAQDEQENDKAEVSFNKLSKALEHAFGAYKQAEDNKDKKAMGRGLGSIGSIYLAIAREPSDSVQPGVLISRDKNVNLNKCIEYANRSIQASEEAGDIEQLKKSYKTLNSAQKMSGNVKGAMASYAKLVSLKKNIFNAKKVGEIEKKQLEYEHRKREDSINNQRQIAQEHLKEQAKVLARKQQELTATEKDKEAAHLALDKTKADLAMEKNSSDEKEKELTLAQEEKVLQATKLELQKSQLQVQKNELEIKDQALEQRRYERWFFISGIAGLLAFSSLAYRNFKVQKKSNHALKKEKKRSEELLLNILPAEVASELMEKGFADAKHFDDVTVLFTDFISFTSVAETMTPHELVGELHVCFKAFDEILGKYHIEKIKTVGDAYLAVAGLPAANHDHASDIVSAAIEIRDFMRRRKEEMGSKTFGIRIGINSGSVVAGIVGVRKFSYDIWGDTVNIAARMEQNSEEGKINMSETTYQLVKDKYGSVYRGKIEAKNKGSIDMYYLV